MLNTTPRRAFVIMITCAAFASACGDDASAPSAPPVWTAASCPAGFNGSHLTIAVSPLAGTVGVGDTIAVAATPLVDGVGTSCNVVLTVDSTHLKAIGDDRYVGIAAGPAGIVATAPNASTSSALRVVDPPYAPRRYRVVDLTTEFGPSGQPGRTNNLNHVVGMRNGGTVLWHDGAFTTVDGCVAPIDLNNNDQILCRLASGYGVWTNGSIKRITALDTISGAPAAMNDAGDVAGAGAIGVFTWIGGKLSLVPFTGQPNQLIRFNNRNQIFLIHFVSTYENEIDVVENGVVTNRAGLGAAYGGAANDYGDIAAPVQGHPGDVRAFLKYGTNYWEFAFGVPYSVNIEEQVVGGLTVPTLNEDGLNADRSLHGPFYWDGIVGLQLLRNAATDSTWVIKSANELTDFGTIRGSGYNTALGLTEHSLLLIPVK